MAVPTIQDYQAHIGPAAIRTCGLEKAGGHCGIAQGFQMLSAYGPSACFSNSSVVVPSV